MLTPLGPSRNEVDSLKAERAAFDDSVTVPAASVVSIASVSSARCVPSCAAAAASTSWPGDERRQVTAHPHPPGGQGSAGSSRRGPGRAHRGMPSTMVAVPPAAPVGVELQAGPSARPRSARGARHLLVHPALPGGAPDHLDHAEGAVGRSQRARSRRRRRHRTGQRCQGGVEGLHPFGREVTGHGPSHAGGGRDSGRSAGAWPLSRPPVRRSARSAAGHPGSRGRGRRS